MALVKVSGPVSNFREETQIKSSQSYNTGYTSVRTEKEVNFRVGNKPVTMKMPKSMELTDGDEATVVGTNSRGGIKAILVRNDTIGIIHGYSTWYIMMWAVILLGAGLVTLQIVVGYLLAPLGLFMLYKGYQHVQAYKMIAA